MKLSSESNKCSKTLCPKTRCIHWWGGGRQSQRPRCLHRQSSQTLSSLSSSFTSEQTALQDHEWVTSLSLRQSRPIEMNGVQQGSWGIWVETLASLVHQWQCRWVHSNRQWVHKWQPSCVLKVQTSLSWEAKSNDGLSQISHEAIHASK